eukprot:TRINITY_DN27496_c0_g1_i1.p1 TRINITY_DN27496_c0_g1~~TRINITY_DN27496_c0_g1_i1.p1  ORF type:complete len:410 (-),score=29.58 TRINITY_DN27496_c0_g1_i1:230-1459(-)
MASFDASFCHEASCVVALRNYQQLRQNHGNGDGISIDLLTIAGVHVTMDVYPNGYESADDGFISLLLSASSPCRIVLNASFRLIYTTEVGDAVVLEETEFDNQELGSKGWLNFMHHNDIQPHLRDDTLRMRVVLKLAAKSCLDQPHAPELILERFQTATKTHAQQLAADLTSMMSEGDGDVTFVLADGEVAAHREILKFRSPVFKAMFQSSMQEASSQRIQAKDVDLVLMERFLHYVYTAEVPQDMFDNYCGCCDVAGWCQLARIGDKYGVRGLVDRCVHHLKQFTYPDTVLEILILANVLKLHDLKQHCLEYASKDKETVKRVHDSPKFECLDADVLRSLLVHQTGTCKRMRADGLEFPDGTDWHRLTYVQLQRACHERGMLVSGEKGELVAHLLSHVEDGRTNAGTD